MKAENIPSSKWILPFKLQLLHGVVRFRYFPYFSYHVFLNFKVGQILLEETSFSDQELYSFALHMRENMRQIKFGHSYHRKCMTP